MPGIWVDNGLVAMHESLLGNSAGTFPERAVLYTNNHTPDHASVYSDFTADPVTIINVNPADWSFLLDGTGHFSQAQITLNFDLSASGGNTYYGILLSNIGGSVLYYAQLFPTPLTVPIAGVNPMPIVLIDDRENCP